MQFLTPFVSSFMEHYRYPREATELFSDILLRLSGEDEFSERFCALRLLSDGMRKIDNSLISSLDILASRMGISHYSLHFCFALTFVEELYQRYLEEGVDKGIYWDTMDDLRCKLLECIECRGVPGSFTLGWNCGFFRMTRFAYGRFQYEEAHLPGNAGVILRCGKLVRPGDLYYTFHIPSSGIPLTDEVRYASYRKAWEHLHTKFPDGKVLFGCGSWLLYPRHLEFLPQESNIRKFIGDFTLTAWNEQPVFSNQWRLFGHYEGLPPEKLPQDTSLRRAYAQWLQAGNLSGDGFGLFLFDGEKIIH